MVWTYALVTSIEEINLTLLQLGELNLLVELDTKENISQSNKKNQIF